MNKKCYTLVERWIMEVKKIVKKLLTDNNLYQAPINVVKLAETLKFTVLQQNLGYDGALLVNDEETFEIDHQDYNRVILVDNDQINTRKRFTIAHEISHFLIEYDGKSSMFAHREEKHKGDPKEREADSLASEILMPYELLDEFVKKCRTKFSNYYLTATAIADHFNVSQMAAEYRYDEYLRGY